MPEALYTCPNCNFAFFDEDFQKRAAEDLDSLSQFCEKKIDNQEDFYQKKIEEMEKSWEKEKQTLIKEKEHAFDRGESKGREEAYEEGKEVGYDNAYDNLNHKFEKKVSECAGEAKKVIITLYEMHLEMISFSEKVKTNTLTARDWENLNFINNKVENTFSELGMNSKNMAQTTEILESYDDIDEWNWT